MMFSKFLGKMRGGALPASTNGIANVTPGGMAQSSAQSFAARQQVESNRARVRKYADASVVRGYQKAARVGVAAKPLTGAGVATAVGGAVQSNRLAAPSSKIDVVLPSRQGHNATGGARPAPPSMSRPAPPPRHTFTEPSSRTRPY